ncbi:MAG: DUF1573 domain-containing protein [Candidatus Cloacimonetes bacterium]|nr:DUF1573 domain-containing protein [Candidatus Cloacimonadota bacterium]
MRSIILVVVLLSINLLLGVAGFTPLLREYDFGMIYEKDGEVEYNFIYTNTGDEPLLLIDVHAS